MSDIDEDDMPPGHIQLKEGLPLNLESILKGQTFQIDCDSVRKDDDESTVPNVDDITAFTAAFGFGGDDIDLTTTPFDDLAEKMENLTPDGKIKKRILRKGVGNTPPERALVSVLYCSYLEFHDEPTDYVYISKPYTFRLGAIGPAGFNHAVASMKVNEKAHFLISSEYCYGPTGHPPRIPPDATFFFHIELIRYSDSGAALDFDQMTQDDRKRFPTAYKTALGLSESAKDRLMRGNVKLAIRDYNRAVSLMDECLLNDMEEQVNQEKLKLKLYTNLAICYNKDNLPKKACTACNDIYNLVKNKSVTVPAKVFFNHGKALSMIGDYTRAREKLLVAQKMAPHDNQVASELLKVYKLAETAKKREKELAKTVMNTEIEDKVDEEDIIDENDQFYKTMILICNDLVKGNDKKYTLPVGLTPRERKMAKKAAEKVGLIYKESVDMYYITKP